MDVSTPSWQKRFEYFVGDPHKILTAKDYFSQQSTNLVRKSTSEWLEK
jgi:hypothetical protein